MCVSSLLPACRSFLRILPVSIGLPLAANGCRGVRRFRYDQAGMTMPESAGESPADQAVVSSISQEMPAHAALVENGRCARVNRALQLRY